MGLLLIYGLNTWLPEIMDAAGYSVGNSLGFLLTLNLGAILGYFLGGRFAERGGVRRTTIGWFAGAAIFLAVFALPLPEPILYGALFLAGFVVFSSQALTYAYTRRVYPNHLRATGVGWTAGVGRLGAICGPLLGGSLIDRRHRLSVGVLCLCNRWCPRGSGGMDRAQADPATAQGHR
jgi:MFS transporter, AAHS family, benzoate transport protein